MSKGKLKGKQIENQSINLSADSTPLNIDSYTVSSASFSNSGKQIINKEYTDSELELKLDRTQLDDGSSSTSSIWSSNKIESMFSGLTFSTISIDDISIATYSVWSSDKIQFELDTLSFSTVEIKDKITATNSVWSSDKTDTEILAILEDTATTLTSGWSSTKIQSKLDTLTFSGIELLDGIVATNSTWSSFKIDSELDMKMSDGLSFSYMFMGNTANRAEPIKPFELYFDNIGDIPLNENYLLNNYATISIGQKIESIQQLSERVQQGWSTYNKDPNKEVSIDLDLSDTSFFLGGVLYINEYLNLDVINFINVPGSSASIETIIGFYEDFKTSFEVENGSIVKFIYNDVETATSNQIVTLNTSDYTIVGGTYSNRFSVYNDGNLNHQIEDNIYSVKDVSDGSYTVVLNNRNNNEYFGLSSSTTTVTLPNAINNGKTITFKDEAGNAGNSNVTISGSIDGSSSIILNTNYGSIKLLWNNNNWWKV